ncbi:thiamine pyrophosphate-binding protein [Flavihumibacter rivuli]|uniref:thiamine pyrophosphate-binding protein n=1 Tax=Flavihumibacter rivuli TaxID=2838156 RepID=UPI001BDEBB38|nr:thiamine pyrophosphate-binding protein [Flavihumibacter rivuli]ULQ57684.1 thiamine pyrophosphate-binding protein [Flavihumibacter rivuli]
MATTPPPPPAGPTVAAGILHYLAIEQVDHVFGIPGGGLANLLVAFKDNRDKFKYIVCRQETGAAYIADGYYRASGKLGVVMVTTGPGATNALTGVMNAQNDGSAMLLITGEVNESFFGLGYLQEGTDSKLNIDGIYASALGFTAMVTAGSNLEAILKQALRDAFSVPRNAVHLSIPNDVTVSPIPSPHFASSPASYRAEPKGVALEEVENALGAITNCKRPLIMLGNGCRQALSDPATLAALVKFAETYAIPVMTTADGKGIFPESHDLSLRVYGIASCEWPYYWLNAAQGEDPYDGIMVIGSSLGELATNKWLPMLLPANNGPFIQVDMSQAVIGRSFPVTHGIVGEAGAFIRSMAKLIPAFTPDPALVKTRQTILGVIKKQYSPFVSPTQYNSTATPAEPAALMRVLQETLPATQPAFIFLDAGNCVGWGVHYLSVSTPWAIHSSLSMGPMGFGVGAALGAKFANPKATCIGIVGDGAFLMHGAEVSTASQYQQGVIWLVLNDNNLGMVSQGQANFFPDPSDPNIWEELYELGKPDLAKVAEGYGADAWNVDSPGALAAIMPKVLANANTQNKPQVIIAHINSASVPPYYDPKYNPPPPPH